MSFYFFRKKKNKEKSSTSHLFIFHTKIKKQLHGITTVTWNYNSYTKFIYNFTDQLHYYEHFS